MKEEIVLSRDGNIPIIYFNVLEDWEAFDAIIKILTKNFGAVILNRIELPDSRLCKISINMANFSLINDPYGNSLRADNREADEYIRVIFERWGKYSDDVSK